MTEDERGPPTCRRDAASWAYASRSGSTRRLITAGAIMVTEPTDAAGTAGMAWKLVRFAVVADCQAFR